MVIWRRSRYSVSFGETGRQDCRDGPESASTRTRGKGRPVNLLPKTPTAKGVAEMFSGDVWIDVIARGEEPSRIRANVVRFNPGARTAWHRHAVGQTLYVTEGVGWVQSVGSERGRGSGWRRYLHATRRVALARGGTYILHDTHCLVRGSCAWPECCGNRVGQPSG